MGPCFHLALPAALPGLVSGLAPGEVPGLALGGAGWLRAACDAVLAAAALAIALLLLRLLKCRREAPLAGEAAIFAAFALAFALGHALALLGNWWPVQALLPPVAILTAIVTLLVALTLRRLLPTLQGLPPLQRVLAMDEALTSEKREKRRVEGRLRETEDRFRLMVEGIRDYALVLLDEGGRVTSWNPGARRMLGHRDEDILGGSFTLLWTEEDRAAGLPEEALREAAQLGRVECEGERVRRDGVRIMVNEVLTATRDREGRVQGFVAVIRDITEQRATQHALRSLAETLEDKVRAQVRELREGEARLQGFIRHAPAAIAFKGPRGHYLLINPRMASLVGRETSAILGRTDEEVFGPELGAWLHRLDVRARRQARAVEEEFHWTGPDGATRLYLSSAFPIVDATGQCWGLGLIATDVTERRQAQQALLQSQKLEGLGVLTGGIAHDFNNLLGAMVGNVELALAAPDLDGARPFLARVQGLMHRAADLLRQMLAYAGRGQFQVRVLDLNRLVEEMAELLDTSISKKAALRLDLHPTPLPVAVDAAQVQQVIMNLVLNASEALDDRTGHITLSTFPEEVGPAAVEAFGEGQAPEPGPHAVLEVADDGPGMAPEVLLRIFDPFFTTKFTGRGLGLAALHGIVRGHHGGIQVSSEPGKGSRFRVLLPLAESGEPWTDPGVPPLARVADGSRTILVVDDEEDMRRVVVEGLRLAGFRVLEARDGQEALEVHAASRADAIVLDLTMPGLDGEETCRELRRRGERVPILLCSGFGEAETVRRFEGLGLAGFVQKPYALGGLVERVAKAVAEGAADGARGPGARVARRMDRSEAKEERRA